MRVVVAGGTGLVGKALVRTLRELGHDVVVVGRQAAGPGDLSWTQLTQEGLPKGTEAVVQLAGQSILKLPRWTEEHKRQVISSRLETAGMLMSAMEHTRPSVYVVASAVGYYPVNTPEPLTEDAAPGADFPAQVCLEVEKLAASAAPHVGRVVPLRIGVVLSKEGGALQQMWNPFSWGLGGVLGSGTQPFPWIHIADVAGLIAHALQTPAVRGPLNAVAPGLCTNAEFTAALGKALHRPTPLPVPAFVLRGLLGEQSTLLLDGPNVSAEAAVASGYAFRFPTIDAALADIQGAG